MSACLCAWTRLLHGQVEDDESTLSGAAFFDVDDDEDEDEDDDTLDVEIFLVSSTQPPAAAPAATPIA